MPTTIPTVVDQDVAPEEEEHKDLTLRDLETLDSIVELGRRAVSMLQSFGSVAFLVDERQNIRLANPLNVFYSSEMSHPPEGVEPKFIRPILHNNRPQYVAKKPDGSLWEVEYPRPELENLGQEQPDPEELDDRN